MAYVKRLVFKRESVFPASLRSPCRFAIPPPRQGVPGDRPGPPGTARDRRAPDRALPGATAARAGFEPNASETTSHAERAGEAPLRVAGTP